MENTLKQIFMSDSEESVTKLRFQDLVFLAGDVSNTNLLPSIECSIIHFEAKGFYATDFDVEEKYCEMLPLSKVLWCVNAKTGECVDWSGDDDYITKSLHHCYSYKSGLCNQNLTKRLMVSRSADWSDRMQTSRSPFTNIREDIEWKAIQEAEVLSKLPRYTDSALQLLQTCDEPRVITECKGRNGDHHVISHVNEAWEELCGHRREEVVGESLSILHGPDTDPDVQRMLERAIADALDASVLIKNYKKNGEPFMNRARVVPMIDRGSHSPNGMKPTHFLASLAAAPTSASSDAVSSGDGAMAEKALDSRMTRGEAATPNSLEF